MTLYDWLLIWLDKYEKKVIKRTTYISYDGYIHNYFIQFTMPIQQVTASLLQDFCNEQLDKGLAVKTVRNMVAILKKAMKRAVTDKIIVENPALNVELPKPKKKEIKILTHAQEAIVIRLSYSTRYGVFIRLTLCTGLRIGELLGLKWEDIDFEKKELHIRRILHRCKNYEVGAKHSTSIFLDEPKTERSKRTIPLPDNAVQDLLAWKAKQEAECPCAEFVVTYPNGKYIEPRNFSKFYEAFLHKCGINGITFHALRHTFATNALERGMDSKVLSEILGHYSVAFTLDTYAHVLDSFKRQNMDLMNDIYDPTQKAEKLILWIKPFQNQYIVSIPGYKEYTFIANSIEDGVNYVRLKKNEIHLKHVIDMQDLIMQKGKDEIIMCID